MGGGRAPDPDPNIGIAALKSAQTGENMLGWMQSQAAITNKWAAEDRNRYTSVFQPLQDAYIADAQNWDSAGRKDAAASQAVADVQQQARTADQSRVRQAMAMGINPNSGRFAAATAKGATDTALAAAGAGNLARRQVEAEAEAKRANAINMGSGLAVNPATSLGLSNGAISTGGQAAMQGYQQQGNLLNQQYQNQLQAYQLNQQSSSGMFGALGNLLGAGIGLFASSKDFKTDKQPMQDGEALGAVREMPVERWRYKPGIADNGEAEHIGPYAEDFTSATGQGNGKAIDAMSEIGLALGAIRDLDSKVDSLAKTIRGGDRSRKAA